jgi:hypothetical protein
VGPTGGQEGYGKSRPPTELHSRTVQPVASGYTDCAIPAHNGGWVEKKVKCHHQEVVQRLPSTKRKMQCSLVIGTKRRTIVSAKLHDVTCHKIVMA